MRGRRNSFDPSFTMSSPAGPSACRRSLAMVVPPYLEVLDAVMLKLIWYDPWSCSSPLKVPRLHPFSTNLCSRELPRVKAIVPGYVVHR